MGVHQRLDAGRLSGKSVAGLGWNSGLFPAKRSTSDKSICFCLFICLLYSVLFWWEAGAGPEEWRALALCSGVGERESVPGLRARVQPPLPQPPWGSAWLSPRLRAGPALSPDACYLHTHLWTNGQPAGSWSPPLGGGPSSQVCVWQFGLEP